MIKDKKYTTNIEETLNQDFEVYASSAEEAREIAIKKYKNGEFVLEPGELTYVKIAVKDGDEDMEWEEF